MACACTRRESERAALFVAAVVAAAEAATLGRGKGTVGAAAADDQACAVRMADDAPPVLVAAA